MYYLRITHTCELMMTVFRASHQKNLFSLTIYPGDTKVSIGDQVRKSTIIVLISILLLQMCTGLLVNFNESDRAVVTNGRSQDEPKYEGGGKEGGSAG